MNCVLPSDNNALPPRSATNAIHEVAASFFLGLRDGLRPRIALTSFVTGLAAAVFWLIVLVFWHEELGTFLSNAARGVLSKLLTPQGVATSAVHPILSRLTVLQSDFAGSVMGVILSLLAYVVLVLLTTRLALEFFFLDRVRQQCLKAYPSLALDADTSIKVSIRNMVGAWGIFIFIGLLSLMVPLIGGVVFILLGGYMNVRDLASDVLEDMASDEQVRAIIKSNRFSMTLLGVLFMLLLLIPLVGFFAPGVMGAAVCHLCMRQLSVEINCARSST